MNTNAPDLSRNLKRCATLTLLTLTCLLPSRSQAQEYPVMSFTPEELDEMLANHMSAPTIYSGSAQTFAPSLSLLPYLPYTPSERDQGACGNCWAWAGTGVMEIAHAVRNGVQKRLSVQFINSCTSQKQCCTGGSLEDFVQFYRGKLYTLPWANTGANWQSGGGKCDAAPCEAIETSPRYKLSSISWSSIGTFGVGQDRAIANIKSVLNQNKAVFFSFKLEYFSPFFQFWNNQGESSAWTIPDMYGRAWTNALGHAVLCVGYDDTDPNNRYWIMVNSWGTHSGSRPNGTFRVPMNLDYNSGYTFGGSSRQAFFWKTLDVEFSGPTPEPEIAVCRGNIVMSDGQSSAVDFGKVANGDLPSTRTFTVHNTGDGILTLGAISVPSGFVVTKALPPSLASGQQTTFTVALPPGTAGTKTGQISFATNDRDENPFNFPVTGVVVVLPTVVWVDQNATCPSPNGSQACPFQWLSLGCNTVAKCGTVRIAPGTYTMDYFSKCALLQPTAGPVLILPSPVIEIALQPGELSAPKRRSDGTVAMRLKGPAGRRYEIQSSTDLLTWDLWKEVIAPDDSFDLIDYDAPTTSHRFFRLVTP